MESSGKRNPCPICHRDKDDKCRWDEEIILCYCGDDFAPSPLFRIGQVVKALGVEWALVNKSGGFAASSYSFIRHKPLERTFLFSEKEKKELSEKKIAYAFGLDAAFKELRKLYQFSLSAPPLEFMTLADLNKHKLVGKKICARARGLKKFIGKNRMIVGRRKKEVTALRIWEKQARYDLKEIESFESCYLGCISKAPDGWGPPGALPP